MVVLGSGERAVQDGLRHLQQRAPDRFAVRFGYDEPLAHKIMAGSDLFLMPSRSEPCGLTQMYALRYGTIPIVRSTGGLVDTVEPFDAARNTGTGFRFETADGTGPAVGARPGARRAEGRARLEGPDAATRSRATSPGRSRRRPTSISTGARSRASEASPRDKPARLALSSKAIQGEQEAMAANLETFTDQNWARTS